MALAAIVQIALRGQPFKIFLVKHFDLHNVGEQKVSIQRLVAQVRHKLLILQIEVPVLLHVVRAWVECWTLFRVR